MLLLFRDPVTNQSSLTLEQLRAFKKLEEITGTEHEQDSDEFVFVESSFCVYWA